MKEKIKKLLKNRIFIFTVAALLFGTIGVSATTYFPSNDVTYDNTESGLTSTDVQGAIDELYNTCSNSKTVEDGTLEGVEIVDCGDGLYEDNYEEGRYVYKGTDPNNYIAFNNNTWRIISLESDGTLKIMGPRADSNSAWSSSGSDWESSSALSNLNSFNLREEAQNQIVQHNFNIGTVTTRDDIATIVNQEKSKTWTGRIGLITLSDYYRATSKDECATMEGTYVCSYYNWIFAGNRLDDMWTMTAFNSRSVYAITNSNGLGGGAGGIQTWLTTFSLYPVVYLSSDINITGGDGSRDNPYIIS